MGSKASFLMLLEIAEIYIETGIASLTPELYM